MNTVRLTEKATKGAAMLLGGFDGLHIGHRRLLAQAKRTGLPVGAMTIVGGKGTDSLFTPRERELIFREVGVDFVFELPFAEIKAMSPQAFLELLVAEFSPKRYICGEDFRFGAGAAGTPALLRALGAEADVLPLLEKDGEKISSGGIKRRIAAGEVATAAELLGQPFFLLGEVVSGRQIGRTLDFPTANMLYPNGKRAPKIGVYETRVCVDGRVYKGITNYGARPTFDNAEVLTETYLDGFTGNLYGRELRVEFVRRLRDAQRFETAELLRAQLQKDIRQVRGE